MTIIYMNGMELCIYASHPNFMIAKAKEIARFIAE